MHRRDGRLIVSATDLVGFLACGHLTQLERAAAAGLIEKPIREDPEIDLLQRRGHEHEGRYIAQLRADGRDVVALNAEGKRPYEELAGATIEQMRRGADVIYQATVFDGRWVGHPDFLLRVDREPGRGPGELGRDHHYEVADTKLAHRTRASALIQICSYVEQVEQLQGVQPEWVHVVLGGAEITTDSFRTAEMMAFYRRAKGRFEQAIDDAIAGLPAWPIDRAASYPDPVDHCAVCRWSWAQCKPTWYRDDALPLVAGITRSQRRALAEMGTDTRRALAGATVEPRLRRVREQARLQVESSDAGRLLYELLEPARDGEGNVLPDRGLSALPPPSAGDLFFDIEGDPFAFNEGLDYLFGVWTASGGWHATWATDRQREKRAFEQVMDFFSARLSEQPDMHIYHYAPYEPSALKRLAGRHATREEELDRLLRGRVFVDLYRVVRQGVRVGAEGYSIKDLEPLYAFSRDIDLRTAGQSIVEFELWLEEGGQDSELLERIEAYNRDDCVSTQRLRDWLEQRRLEAESSDGAALPRPPAGEQAASEEQSARAAAVEALERRLTAGLPATPADRTPEQQATWLLAQLLDWHRRENKAAWWRFFDLLARSDDELFTEREPIARLEYAGVVPAGGTRQSNDHRYRFPPQEHSIDAGNEVHDPQLVGNETRTGGVVAVDNDAGTVDIRRRKSWTGQHPTSIVPLDVFGADAQQAALMAIGEWVAANGIDSELPDYRAARDLLRRLHPRIAGANGGNLVGDDEAGTDAARRLVMRLDATTLPIQGPPGSGKTYTGARMILDLVQAGRRVGITANSHKVIVNLLEEVCRAAAKDGVTLAAVQKAAGEDGLSHHLVTVIDSNDAVETALRQGEAQVGAGTTWLWAREQMKGTVDTLFVDEAGQMSLANVVAISGAARNIVLLGDPQQLDQPTQGVHPEGAGGSALAHFLGGDKTVPPDRGIFLERTWRMHPLITRYTSDLFYESKLESRDDLVNQRLLGDDWLAGAGLRWVPVEHDGNTNASAEEAERVAQIVDALVGRGWVDGAGAEHQIGWADIVIVSPFNAHRLLIQERLGPRAWVGTVDKFQGQQAPVSIYTMATSRPEDAPRGMAFLYSLNRLNVATSRARAVAIVVASDKLLRAVPHSPDQLRMANGLCAFVEMASAAPSLAAVRATRSSSQADADSEPIRG